MSRNVKVGLEIDLLDKVSPGLAKMAKSMRDNWKNTVAGFGVSGLVASTAGLVKMALNVSKTMGQVFAQASQLNMLTSDFLALRGAAAEVGIAHEQAFDALRQFNGILGKAASGSAEAAKVYADLGIATRNLDGSTRSMTDVFLEIADRMQAMPDDASKSALALKLFGETGARFTLLLSQGSDAIRAQVENLKRLRGETDLSARLTGEMGAAQERLTAAYEGTKVALTNGLLPSMIAFQDVAAESLSFFRTGSASISEFVVKTAAKILGGWGIIIANLKTLWIRFRLWIVESWNRLVISLKKPLSALNDIGLFGKKLEPGNLLIDQTALREERNAVVTELMEYRKRVLTALAKADLAYAQGDVLGGRGSGRSGSNDSGNGNERRRTLVGVEVEEFALNTSDVFGDYQAMLDKQQRLAENTVAWEDHYARLTEAQKRHTDAIATGVQLGQQFGDILFSAFEQGIRQGQRLDQILGNLAKSLARLAISRFVGGIFGALGGAVAGSIIPGAGTALGAGLGSALGGSALGLSASALTVNVNNPIPVDQAQADLLVRQSIVPALRRLRRDGEIF